MMNQNDVFSMIEYLKSPAGYHWEKIGFEHSSFIVAWRNELSHLFLEEKKITIVEQDHFISQYASHDRVDFVLCVNETRKPIGVFSFCKLNSTSPEIGKLLGELEYQGRGIAKKATSWLIEFALNTLKFNSVSSITQKDNQVNIKLNESLGFEIKSEEFINKKVFLKMLLKKESFQCVE